MAKEAVGIPTDLQDRTRRRFRELVGRNARLGDGVELCEDSRVAPYEVATHLANLALHDFSLLHHQAEAPDLEPEDQRQIIDFMIYQGVLAAVTKQLDQFCKYFDAEGNWLFPTISLAELKTMQPKEIRKWFLNEFSALQELANFWTVYEFPGMNDHGIRHVRKTYKKVWRIHKLASSLPEEKYARLELSQSALRQLSVATCFHDIGMAISGRSEHAAVSVAVVRQVVEGWDSQDPFCQEIEFLIYNHPTALAENIDYSDAEHRSRHVMQAMLVLGDEMQIQKRTSPEAKLLLKYYAEDPFTRIAEHVKRSKLKLDEEDPLGQRVIWEIETDRQMANRFHQAGVEQPLFESLKEKVLLPKGALIQKLLQVIFGYPAYLQEEKVPPVQVIIQFDGVSYDLADLLSEAR